MSRPTARNSVVPCLPEGMGPRLPATGSVHDARQRSNTVDGRTPCAVYPVAGVWDRLSIPHAGSRSVGELRSPAIREPVVHQDSLKSQPLDCRGRLPRRWPRIRRGMRGQRDTVDDLPAEWHSS